MGNQIQGKNITGYLEVDGIYYNIFCGKTLTFSVETDELETTSVNSGAGREYLPGMYNAIMDVSGVSIIDNTDSRIAITYLQTPSVAQTLQNWKIKLEANNGTIKYYLFAGMIRNTSFDKTIPGYSQSYLTVRVSGGIEVTAVDPPPPEGSPEIVYSDFWDFPAGDTYIQGTSINFSYALEAVTVLQVDRSGVQHDLVTGTPTNRQCKHNNLTGIIQFPTDIPSNGETVFVMFKVIL